MGGLAYVRFDIPSSSVGRLYFQYQGAGESNTEVRMTTSYYPAKSRNFGDHLCSESGLSGDSKYLLYRMGHKRKRIPRSDPDLGKARHSLTVFLGYELL